MGCYSPLDAWKGGVLPSGKQKILWKRPGGALSNGPLHLKLPCGQCIDCRLERSRQWAMRCMHESSLYSSNCFLTLTYSPDNLPSGGSLVLRDYQLFMKRLRKYADVPKPGLRFFHCGEYGSKFGRPHYHSIIFNYDFPDKYPHKKTDRGDQLWRSPILESLWTLGSSTIGAVTFESAAYVARYVCEKINISTRSSAKAKANWEKKYVDFSTGEIRHPEYITMSRRPGIGREWYNKFKNDIFPHDYAILRGMKVRPPRFYGSIYEIENPSDFARIKKSRVAKARLIDPTGLGESSDRRLRVKEEVKIAQLRSLTRNLEV